MCSFVERIRNFFKVINKIMHNYTIEVVISIFESHSEIRFIFGICFFFLFHSIEKHHLSTWINKYYF